MTRSRAVATINGRKSDRQAEPHAATEVAELIEDCRAHVASITELAGITLRALCECYEYEDDEPHLGHCCDHVLQVLTEVHTALVTLGVSHDRSSLTRAAEIAKRCKAQRRLLCPAVHVIRAIIYILQGVKPDYHDQVLPALRDVESGILHVMNALERVIQGKAPGSFQH